jgi:hypothetical protein
MLPAGITAADVCTSTYTMSVVTVTDKTTKMQHYTIAIMHDTK